MEGPRRNRNPSKRRSSPARRERPAPPQDPGVDLEGLLRRAVDDWQVTFDAIESPIVLLESSGAIRRVNRAAQKLSGRDHYRELIGRPVEAIGPGEPWARAGEVVWRIRQSRLPLVMQAHDERTGRSWELSAALVEGDPVGQERLIVVARDVSNTVQLQASLRRSEMMSALGTLVAGVAHEVRNPLFSISATLDAFEARFGPEVEYARYIAVLRTELDRLSQLMQELLHYGKPHKVDLRPEPIAPVIEDAVRVSARLARSRRVRVVTRVDDNLPALPMERSRLLEVFQNLLENAIQHSPPGDTVTVSAQEVSRNGDRFLDCAIEDSGPGFRDEDLPRLFEPFFTRRHGGTGLGLSIVQRIVEQHGGTVSAENRPSGGATMQVSLPLSRG